MVNPSVSMDLARVPRSERTPDGCDVWSATATWRDGYRMCSFMAFPSGITPEVHATRTQHGESAAIWMTADLTDA